MNYFGILSDLMEHGDHGVWIDGSYVYRINPETLELEDTPTRYYKAVQENNGYVPGEFRIYGRAKDGSHINKIVDHLDWDNIWTSMEYKYHPPIQDDPEWKARLRACLSGEYKSQEP